MPYSKSLIDLKRDFFEQAGFLRASCISYDSGNIAEAKRIALAMRILLHDNRSSRSLLGQLGIKEKLNYWSVLPALLHDPEARDLFAFFSALIIRFDGSKEPIAEPNLGSALSKCSFSEWWNGLQVKNEDVVLTRRDIVLSVADTDGGAHIDPELKGSYAELVKNNGYGIEIHEVDSTTGDKTIKPLAGQHELMLVRQIANELLNTLLEQSRPLLDAIV
jgi:hypothetical protein